MLIKRNIPILYLVKAAKWFMLYIPIIYLFYEENNFSATELFGLHAIYSLVIAVLEVPSGYFADVFGRKISLVIGALFGTFGFLAYSLSYSITGFIIAEVFLGIGQSLFSGADSAMLYDTLLQEKRENEYIKYEGRITATGNIAEALAGLTVSLLAFKVVRVNFYLQTGITLIAFIAALFLIEPLAHKKNRKPGYKDIWDIVKYTFRKNVVLRNIVLFSSIIGFASLMMAWFSQPIFKGVGLKDSYFGFAAVILNGLVAIGSVLSGYIGSKMSFKAMLFYLAIPLSVGFIAVAYKLTFYAFIPLSLFYLIRGTAHPMLKKHINDLSESSNRATILSLRSLIIRIFYLSLAPVFGVVTDRVGLKEALLYCGISVSFFAGILLIITLKSGARKN